MSHYICQDPECAVNKQDSPCIVCGCGVLNTERWSWFCSCCSGGAYGLMYAHRRCLTPKQIAAEHKLIAIAPAHSGDFRLELVKP